VFWRVTFVILIVLALVYGIFIMKPSPLNSVAGVLFKPKDPGITCDKIKLQLVKDKDDGICLDPFSKNMTVKIKNLGANIDKLMLREVNGVFFTNQLVIKENFVTNDFVTYEFTPKDVLSNIHIYPMITLDGVLTECQLATIKIYDVKPCKSN
jgi:hypothetical protein